MLIILSTWVFAYALGSIPFGVLFARTQNIDLRAHGSKNIGATNAARLIGKKSPTRLELMTSDAWLIATRNLKNRLSDQGFELKG